MGNFFSETKKPDPVPFRNSVSGPRIQTIRTNSNYNNSSTYRSSYDGRSSNNSSTYRSSYDGRSSNNSSTYRSSYDGRSSNNLNTNRSLYDGRSSNYQRNLSSLQDVNHRQSSLRRGPGSINCPKQNDNHILRNNNNNYYSSNLSTIQDEKPNQQRQHQTRQRQNRKEKQLSPPILRLLKLVYDGDSFFSDDQRIAFHYYKNLKTKLNLLKPHELEYETICNYLKNTHGPTHTFKLSIENIYVSYRLGAIQDFKVNKKLGNRKLLWHGTELSNFPSILSNGLLTKPPSNVKTTGKMFGNGIYFADVVTKAAQYCNADRSNPYGILILAQVALGKEDIKTKSEQITSLPYGKNSVKALGRYQPQKNECTRTKYGVEIPLGRPTLQPNLTTSLWYNEYIVYDVNQIFLEYLVLVKFDF